MMGIRFGAPKRKVLTGAEICIRAFQICSLFPIPYILAVLGYPSIITTDNILSFFFRLGMTSIPRLEALLLSVCYRAFLNEVLVSFILLGMALACGIAIRRLLARTGRSAVLSRWAYAAWIAFDVILRLLPLPFNQAFGTAAELLGFLLRLACLALVLLDLRAMAREAS